MRSRRFSVFTLFAAGEHFGEFRSENLPPEKMVYYASWRTNACVPLLLSIIPWNPYLCQIGLVLGIIIHKFITRSSTNPEINEYMAWSNTANVSIPIDTICETIADRNTMEVGSILMFNVLLSSIYIREWIYRKGLNLATTDKILSYIEMITGVLGCWNNSIEGNFYPWSLISFGPSTGPHWTFMAIYSTIVCIRLMRSNKRLTPLVLGVAIPLLIADQLRKYSAVAYGTMVTLEWLSFGLFIPIASYISS